MSGSLCGVVTGRCGVTELWWRGGGVWRGCGEAVAADCWLIFYALMVILRGKREWCYVQQVGNSQEGRQEGRREREKAFGKSLKLST